MCDLHVCMSAIPLEASESVGGPGAEVIDGLGLLCGSLARAATAHNL